MTALPITRNTLRLIARMRAAVDRITDDLTRALTTSWVLAWDDLAPLFLAAVQELLTTHPEQWPARGTVLRAQRTLHALEQTGIALERLATQVRRDIPTAAREAATIGLDGQTDIVSSQLPYGTTLPAAARHRQHQADAVDAIVRRTAEQVTVRSWRLEADATEAMKRELVRGVVTGDNPRDAARAMVKRVEGQFNGGLSRAMVIARTEVIDAHRQAAEVGQQDHADVLDGWIWHAEVTGPSRTRTCPSCWAKHGTLHPMSEPGPLDHHQGRCSRTPKTKSWADLGFTIDEPPDELPDARAIFDSLPREEQLKIMGPARLQLLDDDAIEWADLSTRRSTEGWRDAFHVTPVADLAKDS
ncbi:phage minor head protein [Microbispora sp. GKU 823]|uniref:phage minor head protein n=1 Tax=Microbispora sp. GKU 823 TaxID=1652100 RepID=UPI0009A2E190|nr:phage minor head protein [Microbispora sp. GKU 823]